MSVSENLFVYFAASLVSVFSILPAIGQVTPILPIPTPRDIPFPGVIQLNVDATDTAHKVFTVHETIPVSPGPLVLLYPEWETGSHAPTGPIASLAGLIVHAGTRRLEWQRDPVNSFAFHLEVPVGVSSISVDFQYLSPVASRYGALVLTPDIAIIPWQNVLLYPAGWYLRDIQVQAQVELPEGFQSATALEPESTHGATSAFATTSLETLVDSPVYAGRYFRRIPLEQSSSVYLDIVADKSADLSVTPEQLEPLRRMIPEALTLFRSHHYAHYDLLVSLSDLIPSSGGLEHLQSSEINLPPTFFSDAPHQLINHSLIPHEFIHSWNGLFRQPADLWTPDLNSPMRDSLLWVYEGQTEFWALALSARSGALQPQQALDILALDQASAEARSGRAWKSLADSNNDPIFDAVHGVAWPSWQRREDYYGEGVLLWLGVDQLIRQQTAGHRSLEDFAQAFFGIDDGSRTTHLYNFDEVCKALNTVAPYDWPTYLHKRLETHTAQFLKEDLARAGYRLAFTNTPTEVYKQNEADEGVAADLAYSIGLSVTDKGAIKNVAWNSPAFRAGLAPGVRLIKINGEPFSAEKLVSTIAQSAQLIVTYEQDAREHTATIQHEGGLRYPHLEPLAPQTDILGGLFNSHWNR